MGAQRKVVELFDSTGEPRNYALFSGRLPEFMAAYPATDGWKVERDVVSAASLATDLVQLHAAAVGAGKRPVELGLPPLPTGYVFRCRLVNSKGEVVRTASTWAFIRDMDVPGAGFRDWERAETNAFQRLIAALGFGGDWLDQDESQAQEAPGATATPHAVLAAVIPMEDALHEPEGEGEETDAVRSSAGADVSKGAEDAKERALKSPQMLAAYQRQIKAMAKRAGKPVPPHGTVEECTAAMEALGASL